MSDMIARLNETLSDRYRVERELGSGAMATAYLAHDLKLSRAVALKVLRPELAAVLGAERFLREIEIAAKLNHPHILPLLDSGTAERRNGGTAVGASAGFLYCAMPYVEGESLRDRLNREKQLPLDEALQITKEVAAALSCAHSQGVVHRDIKPENILFQAGHAVVSDFAIAQAVAEAGGARLTETGIAVGTPAYMSPEQGAEREELDARSDIYSLGCVLYEMLSGDPPHTASTPQALMAKKLSEPTPRISVVRETVPAAVEAGLLKALAKTPADRFATAQEFVDALQTPGEGTEPSERAAERKRPAWRWVAGAAVAVAVVVVGVVLSRGWRSGTATTAVEEIERLVVAPFENRTGDSGAADWGFVAAEFITRAIDWAGVVTVVPASSVRDLLSEVDTAVGMTLAEIARRTGARYAVAGSYSRRAERVRFDVELVNVESGQLLRAIDPVAGAADSLEAVVAALAERVTAATMGVLNPDVGPDLSEWSSPPSLEAFEGLRSTQDMFCRSRWQDVIDLAQPYLQEAPDFAPLLLFVSISLWNLGRSHEADSVLALLEPLREQLTTEERLLADWTQSIRRGDWTMQTRAVEELFRMEPRLYGYHAGLTALRMNRFADALKRLLAQDLNTPCYRRWWPWWRETALAYHMLGRYQEALEVAREGLERFPNVRPLLYYEGIAMAGLGRLDAVDSLLDVVESLPPQPGYSPGAQMAYIALEFRVLGQRDAYDALMDRALAWFAEQPASELRLHRGMVFRYAERWSDADTLLAALIAEEPNNLEAQWHRGVALAHLGRREEALEMDRWLQQVHRPYPRHAHTRARATIAAALGDREGALRLLQQAYQEGMILHVMHRRDPEWEILLDYGPYQEFVRAK